MTTWLVWINVISYTGVLLISYMLWFDDKRSRIPLCNFNIHKIYIYIILSNKYKPSFSFCSKVKTRTQLTFPKNVPVSLTHPIQLAGQEKNRSDRLWEPDPRVKQYSVTLCPDKSPVHRMYL